MAERGLAKGQGVPSVNEELVEPHVESFNYFLSEGMQAVVADMKPLEVSGIRKHLTHVC
jgi:DNA-directed RNA polymerase beta subunit